MFFPAPERDVRVSLNAKSSNFEFQDVQVGKPSF